MASRVSSQNDLVSLEESGAVYSLTIRSERPIEGCELIPSKIILSRLQLHIDHSNMNSNINDNLFYDCVSSTIS